MYPTALPKEDLAIILLSLTLLKDQPQISTSHLISNLIPTLPLISAKRFLFLEHLTNFTHLFPQICFQQPIKFL